jgi:subtilisin family serine protease
MSERLRVRRYGRALLGVATLVALAGLFVAATPVTAAQSTKTYIVQMIQEPAVAYGGGIQGLEATKPAKGAKIDPDSAKVSEYVDYLKGEHNRALAKVGGGQKVYDYGISYNGFAAKLTENQAAVLAKQADVLAVSEDELVHVDTATTPSFLGLDAEGGLWEQLGGPTGDRKSAGAGENIVIGIVDSGIWAESGSFSDRDSSGKLVYAPLNTSKWHGKKCGEGEAWDTDLCNKKLVGARHFNASWGGDAAVEAERPWEFQSPRDYNGHGTHTASTSGGNYAVPTTGRASLFGTINGIAPRARIAAYKALWSTEDGSTASGFTGDLVAAIDQAVADGVDVINYSISGSQTDFANPVMISFLFAADAGVFVSASAGNSGPATSTVAHPGPWVTTVAAGTHNRSGVGSVTLGNGETYEGASLTPGVGPVPIVNASASGLPGADPNLLRQCFSAGAADGAPQLDPAKVAGKIVVCERGGAPPANARVDKSAAVDEAGGVGVVIWNVSASSLNADLHQIPTVHVDHVAGPQIRDYAATSGATATIAEAEVTTDAPAPFTAAFSSRGPLRAGGGDLLKPDVIAPGVDVLAAVAPPGNGGQDFNIYSGTSMSAPHVAGLAALMKHKHPTWSPMAIKSALMTSAGDVLDGANTNQLVIFRQGAGHVRPNSAVNPGLVFDSGFNDWVAMLCGSTNAVSPSFCASLEAQGYSFDVSDMNVASVAIGDLAGVQTVTRRVTNVGGNIATYTPSVSGLSGITVTFDPAALLIGPGETTTLRMTFRRTSAALNAYTGGQITFSDGVGGHTVRIPAVIRPVAIAAPAVETIDAGADDGSDTWTVTSGYDGTLAANAYGAAADAITADEVVDQDPDQNVETDPFTSGVKVYDFTIAAGTQYWAGGTMESTTEAGSDLDVYLFRDINGDGNFTFASPNELVALSADGDSEEIVERIHPATGNYRLVVHGWGTPDGASTYDLHTWTVDGPADGGSLSAFAGSGDPASVTTGDSVDITAEWAGLTAAGTQYRGIVDYHNGSAVIGQTVVIINR